MISKQKIYTIVAIFGFVVLTVALYSLKIAVGQEDLTGKLIIDFKDQTAVYNELQSFGVQTTVTVTESDCIKCLRYFPIESCWGVGTCLDVNKD
jgi:hypothetical protein